MEQSILQAIAEYANSPNMSAWVTAIATFILAVVTIIYVWLTRKMLLTQTGPCVILTVVHDENRTTILQLVARNVGAGLAQDIRFNFSRPLPARASGVTEAQAEKVGEMTSGPLIDGIPALGPGECRKVDWGQYGGLMAAMGKEPIIATCRFRQESKEMPPTRCPLDIVSFVGTAASETPQAIIASEIQKISKSLKKIADHAR